MMMLWNRDDDDDDDIIEWCETKRRLLPPFDSSPVLMNFTHHRQNPKFGSKINFWESPIFAMPGENTPNIFKDEVKHVYWNV